MSEWEWVQPVGIQIAEWGIPFVIGLLFRKRVARWLITAKMRLLNDTISIGVVSVRSYQPTEIASCNFQIYDNIKAKIANTKLINLFSNGLRISLGDFGNIKILIEKVANDEDNEEGQTPEITRIKAVLTPESPLRFGVRDIGQLSEFSNNIEVIFGEIERFCLAECRIIPEASYTIIELPRVGHFLEEKNFRAENQSLGSSIYATDDKITITVKTLSQIGKATKKYVLA